MREYDDNVKKRLRRIEGQVRGVLRMMEEQKDCKEVVSQLSAVRSAVDRAIAYILTHNLEQCLREELNKGENADTERLLKEAMNLLIKSR
ncbi:metal-sensitive transcriptional regulator [Thermoactinomyces mirandus]|uniref:Metal-sensitive transcriptional regulator n=1 Tax=Thermoactinomyces mirandus TaxID=2756294 RepID=A0A7W2ARV4_9BACL|nr:metal-sensitive transcriptional regulator [Thermoactinomyces mirandus]MBA4601776.1 metal-sensitive transcriptional regulator [Thermoactinomyces mirandus]